MSNRVGNGISEDFKVFFFTDRLHSKMQQHVLSLMPRDLCKAIEQDRFSYDCFMKKNWAVVGINYAANNNKFNKKNPVRKIFRIGI